MPTPDATALAGLKVLDLTNLFAAPQVAATLADFGADVVKIEPRAGDPIRRIGVQRGGGSPGWALVARNKRVVTLDLDREEGRDVLGRMLEVADVLVENLTPSLLGRWGCDFETLTDRFPRLVVTSISCYGRTGPLAGEAGAGTLAEAFAGFAHMNGEADGPPMVPSLPLGDTLVGLSGVIGTMMALYERDRAGAGSAIGQHVDVSMVEPILQLLALPLASREPGGVEPKRMGSRVAGGVPRNLYRAKGDDWLALSGTTDAQVARILELLGRTSDEDRARFGESGARLTHADELDGLVASWIAARPRSESLDAFSGIRIPVAPVNDLGALLEEPQVRARASVVAFDDAEMGSVPLVAPTPRLGRTPGQHRHLGPALGAHNETVYREWIGLSDDDLLALAEGRVI